MKIKSKLQMFISLAFLCLFIIHCGSGENQSDSSEESRSSDVIKMDVDSATVVNVENLLDDLKQDPESMKLLGHYALMNRNLPLATWLYALADEKNPGDMTNKANLAVLLNELYLTGIKEDSSLRDRAISTLENILDQSSDQTAVLNNLGYALYRRYQETNNQEDLKRAETLLRKANKNEPGHATIISHLAAVEMTLNNTEEAVTLLNTIHNSNPFNAVFSMVSQNMGEAYTSATNARSYCDEINFHCDQNCPKSIIGRLQFVTCEMEQQSALLDCRAGKPYYTEYNCDEEIGNVPFLIPGLNSGVCIPLPYFKLCIMLQGGGKVDYQMEFQVPLTKAGGINLKAEGRYEPSSGQISLRFGSEAEINLVNSGYVATELNKRGLGPLNINIPVSGQSTDGPVQVKTYNAVIWN